MGRYQKGLFKTDFSTWTSFDTVNSKLPSNQITCLAIVDSKSLWVGTSKGLAQLKSNAWQTINAPNYNLSDSIRCLFCWFSKTPLVSKLVLALFKQSWGIVTADGSAIAKNICAIIEDAQGAIWLQQTLHFIFITTINYSFCRFKQYRDPINSGYTNFVEDFKGNVWVGWWQPSISESRIQRKHLVRQSYKFLVCSVTALCVDENKNVWAATGNALCISVKHPFDIYKG